MKLINHQGKKGKEKNQKIKKIKLNNHNKNKTNKIYMSDINPIYFIQFIFTATNCSTQCRGNEQNRR